MAKVKETTKTKKTYYSDITITCACGASFKSGSTLSEIRVDICSNCHPFFTGTKRLAKAQGRVDKFNKKYNIQTDS